MLSSRPFRFAAVLASLLMVFTVASVDQAEARRGGSFGSRGTRTFQTAPATPTSPRQTGPINQSVTPRTQTNTAQPGVNAPAARGGFFGSGFGGSLMRGLFIGGLFGLLLGHGFGGMAGMFGLLFQVLLIAGGIWLVMRLFRSRQPAMAGAPRGNVNPYEAPQPRNAGPLGGLAGGLGGLGSSARKAQRSGNRDEIGIEASDLDTFERLLSEVQTAYGNEDYATLRRIATPEMMGYLSEELGQNASRGVKNEVSAVKLLQGDLSESWREGNRDYATVAMRYESIDVTRDRSTGQVVDGDDRAVTQTTELWTFTRQVGASWQLSAIQEA